MVRIHPKVYQPPIDKLTNEFLRSYSLPAYFDRGLRYFKQGRADTVGVNSCAYPGNSMRVSFIYKQQNRAKSDFFIYHHR